MRSTLFPPASPALPALAVLAAILAGCSGDENSPPPTPALIAIEVAPSTATVVAAGGAVQFSALGVLEDSSTTHLTATWSATGGTITPEGNYTAGSSAGTYNVTAASGTHSATATVKVTASTPGHVELGLDNLPGSAALTFPTFLAAPAGDTRLFIVERPGRIRTTAIST